jgi:hypothetical protein
MKTFAFIILASALFYPSLGSSPASADQTRRFAQMPAPTGHRQPTQNDVPPSVLQNEAPASEATPSQRGKPNAMPDGVPRICNNC